MSLELEAERFAALSRSFARLEGLRRYADALRYKAVLTDIQGVPMNPILQALLDQFKNMKIDVEGLLKDPELLPSLMPVFRIVLNHVKAPTD